MSRFYVRKSGSDVNAGTSAGAAWQTIGKGATAAALLTPGDIVSIGAGTYRETVSIGLTGTPYSSTLNGAIDASQTSMVVTSAASLPTAPFCLGVDTGTTHEKLLVTAVAGTTLTIQRGAFGSQAQAHSNGAAISAITVFEGDVDGTQTGDRGEVNWSGYTTNDTSAPSVGLLLNTNGKNNLAFSKIHFVCTNANPAITVALSTGCAFTDCSFQTSGHASGIVLALTTTPLVAASFTLDRCIFIGAAASSVVRATLATVTGGADFDYNILIQNSLMLAAGASSIGLEVLSSGANANTGGGIKVFNCTIYGGSRGVFTNAAALSTTLPAVKIYDSLILGATTACLQANTSGQITENWNRLWGLTVRTNVSAGANSDASVNSALLLEIGQSFFQGRGARSFFSPMAGSPLLAFGAQAGAPSVDLLNRARPGTAAVGALELSPVFPGLGKGRLMGGG